MSLQSHIEINPCMLPLTKRCPHAFTNSKCVCSFPPERSISPLQYDRSALDLSSQTIIQWLSQLQLKLKKLVKLDHLPNIPRGGVTHIAKKKCLKTTAQLSCAKLVRRDGQCRLCRPVLHENSVWYPETIRNKNNFLHSKGIASSKPSLSRRFAVREVHVRHATVSSNLI